MSELEQLRAEILDIDSQIVAKIAKRFELAKKIGEYKTLHNLPIFDPKREELLKQHYAQLSEKYSLTSSFIQQIFRLIHEEAKLTQAKIK